MGQETQGVLEYGGNCAEHRARECRRGVSHCVCLGMARGAVLIGLKNNQWLRSLSLARSWRGVSTRGIQVLAQVRPPSPHSPSPSIDSAIFIFACIWGDFAQTGMRKHLRYGERFDHITHYSTKPEWRRCEERVAYTCDLHPSSLLVSSATHKLALIAERGMRIDDAHNSAWPWSWKPQDGV